MKSKGKILVVSPRFPFPEAGADEQERACGLRQLKRLGFEVSVISKFFPWQKSEAIISLWESFGIPVTLIPYLKHKRLSFILDGAASEYGDPAIRSALNEAIRQQKPDIVWFEYTYLWPLYGLVKKNGIPIVVRSINNEARHFLEEDGKSLLNYIKFVPKYLTEETTSHEADLLFSITPYEKKIYEEMNAKHVVNLPLRSLPEISMSHTPRHTEQLHVFFSGSTYNVAHNRKALDFLVKNISPAIAKIYADRFVFHFTGAKFPDELKPYIGENVIVEGFVQDREDFLQKMDIAISPSFFGGGMQQKVFEPMRRGFPTITNNRAIAGYGFVQGEDFLPAETVSDYCQALATLIPYETRLKLSNNVKAKSELFFSRKAMDSIIQDELNSLIKL